MATIGQVYYNVIDANNNDYISSAGVNIYDDIVSAVNASFFTKLGVQAPPGTKMVINGNKNIMVGRTGIYELENDIQINSLKFIRPFKYTKDEEATAKAKNIGVVELKKAEDQRTENLTTLKAKYPDIPIYEIDAGYNEFWEEYKQIQETYIDAYETAIEQYNFGVNGIYTLPNPDNINDSANYEDLYNVIVDFIYE